MTSTAESGQARQTDRYVAHFDILGFRAAVFRNPDEAWGALSDLRKAMDAGEDREYQIAATREYIARRVRMVIFSDTVVAFTASDENQDLLAILIAMSELFKDALNSCVPLRGGIAFGDFRVNLALNLFAGPALIDAYDVGEEAQWLGIVVTDDVADRYSALLERDGGYRSGTGEPLLRRWDLPQKGGAVANKWVLNWPAVCHRNFTVDGSVTLEQWYEAFEPMFGDLVLLDERARTKHENTLSFVNQCRQDTEAAIAKGPLSMDRWFNFRFRFVWPEEERAPRLWIDVLILDTLVRDVINKRRPSIRLWRVHRRAARTEESGKPDQVGHQFSLMVFTSEAVANEIDSEVLGHSVKVGMDDCGLLRQYLMETDERDDVSQPSGTSATAWSSELQKSWPYYIHGASEMLLDLAAHCKAGEQAPGFDSGLDRVTDFYQRLHEQLCGVWQQEGHKAFLHQLNGLFGYVPVMVPPDATYAQLLSF